MESFSADTLLSSSRPSRNGAWSSVWRPTLTRALPSHPWHTLSDSFDPPVIAPFPEPDYPRIKCARDHPLQGPSTQLLYTDSRKVYPSPPSGPSPSKATIPLPEEPGEFPPLYSTHLAGVLDSPPVMRREDLASQKPLTPPPTMPHPTLNLPDADVDIPFYDPEVEEIEEECETDASYSCPDGHPSPHSIQSVLPLSPLSPSWDASGAQTLSIPSSHFSELEDSNALFSPYDSSAPLAPDYCHSSPLSPREPSSLLEVDVDAPRPVLARIGMPWDSNLTVESDPEPPSSSTSSSSLPSLIDHDELPPPSSPLISRLDLPDLEDDGLPEVVPSSPSRRSCSCLPDADIEMGDTTSDPALALPGQQLLSLPGADTDDDLIPRIVVPPRSIPFTPNQPLLFIDDPQDVPLPRSPSPEDFDLCLSPEDITDPELAKLFDLRKRSIAAERAARRLESLTDDVDLFTRAEARKIRKRERERSKEVGTLLRLKLGDGVAACPQEPSPSPSSSLSPSSNPSPSPEYDAQGHVRRRGVIGSMSQLVAQMVFRRNEISRPLAKRRMANATREYVRSALSSSGAADPDD